MSGADGGPVLITGGAGFIGTYVARALADRGQQALLLDIQQLSPEGEFVLGPYAGDVPLEHCPVDAWPRLFELVQRYRPQAIVHIAAIVNPVYLATNPHPAVAVNFGGTVNVFEAARLLGVPRVVNFSSIGALAEVQYEPIDAAHPVLLARGGPGSGFYGAAKVAGEAFACAYVDGFGLDVRTIRPSAVYGFGMQWPIYIKPLVEGAARGESVHLPSGGPFPRDYTHAEDVASLTLAVLDAPDDADRIFYAATGEPLITTDQLAEVIRGLVPDADIRVGDALTDEDRLELAYRGRLSIDNARNQLGWNPRYIDVGEGVAQYLERFRAFMRARGDGAQA